MTRKKKKRHSGWVTPKLSIRMDKKGIIDNNLEPQMFYDDWDDYRDGQRDWFRDGKKIKKTSSLNLYNYDYAIKRMQYNKKQKRLLLIRKARLKKN